MGQSTSVGLLQPQTPQQGVTSINFVTRVNDRLSEIYHPGSTSAETQNHLVTSMYSASSLLNRNKKEEVTRNHYATTHRASNSMGTSKAIQQSQFKNPQRNVLTPIRAQDVDTERDS